MVWPAIIGAIGALAAGALSAKGQRDANEANLAMSRESRDWMADMSNTSYQRAVRDMQLAGLNPMLAYSQGGAQVPTASTPVAQNVLGAGVQSAAQAMTAVQGFQAMQQSRAQTENIIAQTAKTQSETMERDLNSAKLLSEVERSRSLKGLSDAQRDKTQQEILGAISDSATKHAQFQEMNKGGFAADVAKRKYEAELLRLEKGRAEFYKRPFDAANKGIDWLRDRAMEGVHSGRALWDYWRENPIRFDR